MVLWEGESLRIFVKHLASRLKDPSESLKNGDNCGRRVKKGIEKDFRVGGSPTWKEKASKRGEMSGSTRW
jgi:hypothetical protein